MKTQLFQGLVTLLGCLACMLVSYLIVDNLWPVLRSTELVQNLSEGTAGNLTLVSGLSLFFVLTHMQRGMMDPLGYWFIGLYCLSCTGFALSSIPASQNNVGMATTNLAFALMLLSRLLIKWYQDRKQE